MGEEGTAASDTIKVDQPTEAMDLEKEVTTTTAAAADTTKVDKPTTTEAMDIDKDEEVTEPIYEPSGVNNDTPPKTIIMVGDSIAANAIPDELENMIEDSLYKIYMLNIGVPRVDDPDPEEENLEFEGARDNQYEKPKPKKPPTYHVLK